MKNSLNLVVTICITCLFLYLPPEKTHYIIQTHDSVSVITISAVGDLMCHSVQYNYARTDSGTFNFNPFFEDIKEYLSSADFTFGNFETVTAGSNKGYSGYPFFNSPDEYIDALKNAGFDMLTTVNNHCLDRGEAGLRRTTEQMSNKGLHYNGTFISQADRDSIRIININGIKISFLAYTYGTNGIPVPRGKPFLVNLIDTIKIKDDLKTARAMGCDIVLVHFHFGEEYQRLPDPFQKSVVNACLASGADIIIGGHPHVIQPVDYYKTSGASLDTGLVVYSLGNFFSNQRWRYSDGGVIVYITLEKNYNTGKIRLLQTEYLPTWVYKSNTTYRILPAGDYDSYSFLNNEDKQKMKQSFEDTREILSKYRPVQLKKTLQSTDITP